MPMDFPDMASLESAAKVHKFRKPLEGETEEHYRTELADHVLPIDFIESEEIRSSRGWNKWDEKDATGMLLRNLTRNRREWK